MADIDNDAPDQPALLRLGLRLVPLRAGFPGSHDVGVEILIDDTPLIELVRQVELGFEKKVAGAYLPASLEYLGLVAEDEEGRQTALGQGHFAGAREASILVCDCGEASCWSLNATIEVHGNRVRWDGLSSTLSRRDQSWNYRSIEPLLFDGVEYFAALDALLPEIETALAGRPPAPDEIA